MRIAVMMIIVAMLGCNGTSSGVRPIEREAFVALYADLETTTWGATRRTADTVALARTADSVLAARGVSRDRYLETLRWYNADGNRWRGFFDEVGKVLEDRSKREQSLVAPVKPSAHAP